MSFSDSRIASNISVPAAMACSEWKFWNLKRFSMIYAESLLLHYGDLFPCIMYVALPLPFASFLVFLYQTGYQQ